MAYAGTVRFSSSGSGSGSWMLCTGDVVRATLELGKVYREIRGGWSIFPRNTTMRDSDSN